MCSGTVPAERNDADQYARICLTSICRSRVGPIFSAIIFFSIFLNAFPTSRTVAQEVESSPEQAFNEGLTFAASGDQDFASNAFHKAWEADPTNAKYVENLTVLYIHSHQFSKALEILRDYVKRVGPTSLGWTLQGELLFEEQRYDLAYQSLDAALNLSSNNFRAHELMGLVFSVFGRLDLGVEQMQLAAAQNPSSPQVRFYLGRLHYQTNNYLAARNDFAECLKLRPAYPRAQENLGLAYEALGQVSEAMKQYQDALSLERAGKTPRSEYPYVCLALLLAKQGQTEEAIVLLKEGQERNPSSPWANFELGTLLFKTRDFGSAEFYLKQAASLDSKFSRVHYFLGMLYQKTNRPNDAKAELALFRELDKTPENWQPDGGSRSSIVSARTRPEGIAED